MYSAIAQLNHLIAIGVHLLQRPTFLPAIKKAAECAASID